MSIFHKNSIIFSEILAYSEAFTMEVNGANLESALLKLAQSYLSEEHFIC